MPVVGPNNLMPFVQSSDSWAFPKGFAIAPRSVSSSGGSRKSRLLSFFRRAGDVSAPVVPAAARPEVAQKLLGLPGGPQQPAPGAASAGQHTAAPGFVPSRASARGPAAAGRVCVNPSGAPPAAPVALQQQRGSGDPTGAVGAAQAAQAQVHHPAAVLNPDQQVLGLESGFLSFQAAAATQQLPAQNGERGPSDCQSDKERCSDEAVGGNHVPRAAQEPEATHRQVTSTANGLGECIPGEGDLPQAAFHCVPDICAIATLGSRFLAFSDQTAVLHRVACYITVPG